MIWYLLFSFPAQAVQQGSFLDFVSFEYKIILKWECNKLGYTKGFNRQVYCKKPETYLKYNDEFNVMGLTQKDNIDCHREFYKTLFNPISRLLSGNVKVKLAGEDIVKRCYFRKYFKPFKHFPKCVRAAVFDAGVLAGPHRAIKLLQKTAGISQDSKLGPQTNKAVKELVGPAFLKAYHFNFISYLKRTKVRVRGKVKSLWYQYHRGWTKRVQYVQKISLPYCMSE